MSNNTITVAHRGGAAEFPQNALSSFVGSWQYVDWVECDIWLDSHEKLVISHDPPKVGDHPPPFKDLLALMQEQSDCKKLVIDIKGKSLETVRRLAAVLGEYGISPDRVICIAFDPALITECRKAMADVPCFLLTNARCIEGEVTVNSVKELMEAYQYVLDNDLQGLSLEMTPENIGNTALWEAFAQLDCCKHVWMFQKNERELDSKLVRTRVPEGAWLNTDWPSRFAQGDQSTPA